MSKHTASFAPKKWLRNPHVQTLLPRLVYRQRAWRGDWQTEELSDGDFIELCWHPKGSTDPQSPLLLLFHGLEGSVDSPYVWQTMDAAAAEGWAAVTMHFRGCGREPVNRLPRAYHSGDIGDAQEVLRTLRQRFPQRPIVLAGFSLGGNMLAQLLTTAEASSVTAAAIACAPLDLEACSQRIEHGFSRIYRRYLLTPLKQKFQQKRQLGIIGAEHPLAKLAVSPMRSFFQFDDKVTAPLHGFSGVEDYYRRASGKQFLSKIQRPTLIIHAADDPFMGDAVVPNEEQLAPSIRYEQSHWGGHMGFINYTDQGWQSWLPQRLVSFLKENL